MLDAFWLALLVKVAATASIVVAASVVAERAGPFWGALIACLPVVAGPAYILLALQSDAHFVATSALSGVAANAPTGLFALVLHLTAPRQRLLPSLGLAMAVWLVAILVLQATGPWGVLGGVLLNIATYGAAICIAEVDAGSSGPVVPARWYELPLRALSVGLLVTATVSVSHLIGPSATGLAMAFPIATTSLTVVLHRRLGGAAVGRVMGNSLKALPGLAVGLLLLAETVVPLGVVKGLLLGLAGSSVWSLGLLALHQRRRAMAGFSKATGV